MGSATELDGDRVWTEALDLAGLHACRTLHELHQELTCKLVRLLPGVDACLCLFHEPDSLRAEIVLGGGCPWQVGATVDPAAWQRPGLVALPLHFRRFGLGQLLLSEPPAPVTVDYLQALLTHYAIAVVNLTLYEESRRATDHYCASVQSLQEGIVLFQESDQDAVMARLLDLASGMLQATAGALYVLDSIGDPAAELRLDQCLGIPGALLQRFSAGEGHWPTPLLAGRAAFFDRHTDTSLGGLDLRTLPPVLQNLVALPLSYHGVVAGIVLLFNVVTDRTAMTDKLERLDSLGQLGAALLHRFWLENETAQTHTLQRELQIAEKIQERLLPQRAPAVAGYEFAWRSIAAQIIGGDYLDLLTSDLGDVYALIADASGHGINSALLMSSFRSTWRAEAAWQEPADLVRSLNCEVTGEVGSTGMFITAAHMRLEPESGRLTVTSAGHNPLLLYRARTDAVLQIESHGPPLGFTDTADYREQVLHMERGDVLLLYTDGITEAANRDLDMFGEERLIRVLADNASRGASAILDEALRALEQFTGRDRHDDDVSLSVIKKT